MTQVDGFHVIDLRRLTIEEDEQAQDTTVVLEEIAAQVNEAFQHNGLLILTNHGIPHDILTKLKTAAHEFFTTTSTADKATCAYRAPVPRGYSGNKKENFAILAGNTRPNDLVEKYRMGPWKALPHDDAMETNADAQMLYFSNKWPAPDICGLQEAMETYYEHMERLSRVLWRVFACCLKVPIDFFLHKMDHHASILSVNHYPPITKQVQKGQLRLAEHTDVDLFTILCPDDDDAFGCLQVRLPSSNEWTSVPLLPQSLIVNIGDCLEYWTSGHWRSTCHRVRVPETTAAKSIGRMAIGYFVNANYDAMITRLPSTPEEAWDSAKNTTFAGWRKARIQRAMAQLAKH